MPQRREHPYIWVTLSIYRGIRPAISTDIRPLWKRGGLTIIRL